MSQCWTCPCSRNWLCSRYRERGPIREQEQVPHLQPGALSLGHPRRYPPRCRVARRNTDERHQSARCRQRRCGGAPGAEEAAQDDFGARSGGASLESGAERAKQDCRSRPCDAVRLVAARRSLPGGGVELVRPGRQLPDDSGVFVSFEADTHVGEQRMHCTDPVQTCVDLMHCGGRSEEAAKAVPEQGVLPPWKLAHT